MMQFSMAFSSGPSVGFLAKTCFFFRIRWLVNITSLNSQRLPLFPWWKDLLLESRWSIPREFNLVCECQISNERFFLGLIYEVNLCLGVHDGRCPDLRDMDRKGPKDHSGSWISNLELGDLLHDHVACTVIYIYIERERERERESGASRGRKFQNGKNIYTKERICL